MTAWSPLRAACACFSTVASDSPTRVLNLPGNLTQGIQDVFLSRRLHLLLIEDVAGAAVLCAQPQHVLASEAGNRAFQDGSAGGSLADFPGELRTSAAHPPAGPSDRSVFWMRSSETRLRKGDCSELYRQPLAKRPVKHRIARRVGEIGEDNRVLVRELRRAVQVDVARNGERQQQPRQPAQPSSSVASASSWLPAAGAGTVAVTGPSPCRASGAGGRLRMSEACW